MSEAFLPTARPWLLIHSTVQLFPVFPGQHRLLPAPCSQLPWEFLSHLGISSATSLSFGTGAVSARGSQGGAQQCSLTRLWTPGQTVCHYYPDGFSLKSPLLTPQSSDLSLPSPKDPGQGLSPCSSAQNQQEQGFSAVIFA